ncbi:MAG: winged helix-turn-helix domain-containing protein [Actinomycetota bacterium]
MLVLADANGPLERLVMDLVILGYRPSVHASNETPMCDPMPAAVILLSRDVNGHAVPWSETLRRADRLRSVPLMWLVDESELVRLSGSEHLIDEFLTIPYSTSELAARLMLLRHRSGGDDEDVIRHGGLMLNPSSYQVSLDDRVLDLTYMEYELVKLLIGHPGRVYKREEILSQVWGYDYFGGMRTVDVHVRRVRAKLGQDHAWLLETVRGVGYRLAQARA